MNFPKHKGNDFSKDVELKWVEVISTGLYDLYLNISSKATPQGVKSYVIIEGCTKKERDIIEKYFEDGLHDRLFNSGMEKYFLGMRTIIKLNLQEFENYEF